MVNGEFEIYRKDKDMNSSPLQNGEGTGEDEKVNSECSELMNH